MARLPALAAMALLAAALSGLAAAPAAFGHEEPALPEPPFAPPPVGSYALQRIMAAPEGRVLGLDGRVEPLSRYTRGRITLLGFIYTSCTDPAGCPLAYRVFAALEAAVAATPAFHGQVRLVSLSFDPARDRPATMARYAGSHATTAAGGLRWYFLMPASARQLSALLAGFGQDVQVDGSGPRARRQLSHVLKVFLLDRRGDVREIYSSSFLYPRLVVNDIATLLLEEAGPATAAAPMPVPR